MKHIWRKPVFIAAGCIAAATASAATAESALGMTHRMMVLIIQLGVILFAARLGNMLFEKLRLPGVVGELVAGIVIGPHIVGGIPLPGLGFPEGLFHVPHAIAVSGMPVSPELYGICAVASIVLLFMVGLETDIRLFMRYSLTGSLVGVGGVVTSFVLGDLAAVVLSRLLFGLDVGFMSPACLLLGTISTATSVGITARILSEQRQIDSAEGVTILAGAVIDDVLGIILLAITMGLITASGGSNRIDWAHIGMIAAKAVGVWVVATAVGLLASRKISTLLKWFGERSSIAVMALGLAMILAGLFEEAGLAMIVGAYVMGLSLSRSDITHVVREKIHPIASFLVPVFFTVMGMLVDVQALLSVEVLVFGLLFSVVAVLSKIVGCGMPALFCNFNTRGALRIGAGMLPRGEVTLIIAGVGLAAELLDQRTFGVVVFMTLAAALLAPPLIVGLFRSQRSGVRKPGATEAGAAVTFSFPSLEAADLLVSKLREVFESEGFFVHTLDRREKLYQLRKDDLVIGFRHAGTDIIFDCPEADVPLVNTAMYEVLAELEHTISQLRQPVDHAAIVRKLQADTPPQVSRLASLAEFVREDLLAPDLRATTKERAIDELLGKIDAAGLLDDMDGARAAVRAREKSMSTGMQYGIAIPHGRTDGVARLVCAVGLAPDGVDFASIDGAPSRIIVLTLSPHSRPAPHVQFMSTISQILNPEGRAALLQCKTAADMYRVLTASAAIPWKRTTPLAERVKSAAGRSSEAKQTMQPGLSRYLRPDLVKARLEGETKEAIIDELIDLLHRGGAIRDEATVRATILEREAQMSTGMENGIAIPHARTADVRQLICAVGLKKNGVDFDALDGQPSRIFVLTLSPPDAADPHIQFMSMISRILDEEGRDRVLAAETDEELWQTLIDASVR